MAGPTVALATLGCKVNQAETEELAAGLARAGLRRVEFGEAADVYVINTCTVTHIADRKSRQLVRQARRRNLGSLVVVTGCYAEVSPVDVAKLGVDLVVGNADKARLVDLVLGACPAAAGAMPAPAATKSRTRAFIKVQDGCDSFCTYCIVPRARGRQRSEPVDAVIAAARARVAEGYREVVLTGVHVGAYGRDLAGTHDVDAGARYVDDERAGARPAVPRAHGHAPLQGESAPVAELRGGSPRLGPRTPLLTDLLRAILAETSLERVRLSSLEPEDLTPELLALWAGEAGGRLCRHFHLPLQSGSDGLLRRMGRRYTTADYARLVSAVRQAVPGVAITTDLMVGFPGESEAEYEASREFVRATGFAGLHVFRYSPRPGTPAVRLPGQVPATVAKRRSEEMIALAAGQAVRFRAAFVGQVLDVLYEERAPDGPAGPRWTGLTDNYIRVYVESDEDLANQVWPTRLLGAEADGLAGSLQSHGKSTL